MIKRINIPLEENEFKRLFEISQKELRNPIEQAHFFIRKCLFENGQLIIEKEGGINEEKQLIN